MKTAIIIFAVLTMLNFVGYKLTFSAILNNTIEAFKASKNIPTGLSVLCGACRLFMYIFACVLITLLLIYFI